MSKRAMWLAGILLTLAPPAFGADPKTYQVTGPVLETTADTITVQKGSDKWEIAKDASTKITGDVQKGAKVTIQYRMTATTIDAKAGGGKTGKTGK